MCKKYINATAACFKSVTIENDKIISFNAPFNSIQSTTNAGLLAVDNFSVITQIDFLGTNDKTHANLNPLVQRKTIDFIIRLTKCNKSEEKRLGFDLDNFSIDLEEMSKRGQIENACFDFMNYTRITNIDQLDLPGGAGKYVIKVLVKDSEEPTYTIQSMTSLTIL